MGWWGGGGLGDRTPLKCGRGSRSSASLLSGGINHGDGDADADAAAAAAGEGHSGRTGRWRRAARHGALRDARGWAARAEACMGIST
eukprot:5965473-Prymnesium_polylepis.1